MKRICVYCGSSPGAKQDYIQAAQLLGQTLAERDITLVYGGASVGIMGQMAKACLEAGGDVIGVISKKLFEEVAYTQLAQLHVVDTMHEQKAKMVELSDGFIALPGGLGTIEEFFEVLTWAQLGIHQKPCGLLNTCQYYKKLIDFLNDAVQEQFVELIHQEMIQVDESPHRLLKKLETYQAPQVSKTAWALQMTNNVK